MFHTLFYSVKQIIMAYIKVFIRFPLYYKNPYKRCKITAYKGLIIRNLTRTPHYMPACFATSSAKLSSLFSMPSPVS